MLCKTLSGLDCDVLTITEDGKEELPVMPGGNAATSNTAHRRKKCIFFTGRVHPGETQVRRIFFLFEEPTSSHTPHITTHHSDPDPDPDPDPKPRPRG